MRINEKNNSKYFLETVLEKVLETVPGFGL